MGDDPAADADSEAVDAYILSSKYRSQVVGHLAASDASTPTEIAANSEGRRPHISRALSELREEGVVELNVPDDTAVGRYYDLSPAGEDAWQRVKEEIRSVEWTIEAPETEREEALVDLASEAFGDGLRTVATYDGDSVRVVYIDDDVRAAYTDEEFEEALRSFVFEYSLQDITLPRYEFESEAKEFDEFTVLRVRVTDDHHVAVSYSSDRDATFPALPRRIRELFDA